MRPDGEPEYLSPIDPYALLRHARRRINAPDAEETDYRRAVSDAYYALYHAVTLLAAPVLSSTDDPLEPYRRIRRFRHWHLRDAAEEARESADGQVRIVARAILRLHARRMAADYSHLARFTQVRARRLIGQAEAAVEAVTAPAFTAGGGQSLLRQLAALPAAP